MTEFVIAVVQSLQVLSELSRYDSEVQLTSFVKVQVRDLSFLLEQARQDVFVGFK